MSIEMPMGARCFASEKFNDFYGVWVQHPGENEFRTFSNFLKQGGVYLDVGANMGFTSVVAGYAGSSRIIAFEPTHKYAAVWHDNVVSNKVRNATLIQGAVGEAPGMAAFIVNVDAPMHNRLNMGKTLERYKEVRQGLHSLNWWLSLRSTLFVPRLTSSE